MNHMYRVLKTSSQLDISTTALLRMSLQCIKRNYCSSKEISDSQLSQGQDILLQNMKSATDVSDVLYSVKLHHAIMNNKHLMQAFRSIFILQKSENSNMSNGEVIISSGFRVLCESLKSNVRTLHSGDILDALKTLSYLGVSSNSKLVQILLNVLTKEINGLSLPQLLFFDFLLKDFVSSPIVEALRIALPVVIESNIRLKLDADNIHHLSDLLHFATKRNLSQATINYLIEAIMRNRRLIDLKSSRSIIRSLCDVSKPQDYHRPLLHCAINVLIANTNLCNWSDLDSIVSKLASRYSTKNSHFYHEVLLDTASRCAINNSVDFAQASWLLRKLLKSGHVSIELLNYIAGLVDKEPSIIWKCEIVHLFTLVGGFAQADYKPFNWAVLEPVILERVMQILDRVDMPWVRFTRDLCTLDCWPTDMFRTLFSDAFLERYLDREHNFLDHLQVLSLNSLVSSLCNSYSGPLLPRIVFDEAVELNFSARREYPLKRYISAVVGKEAFLVTGVMTRQGHSIEYLVILGKGGICVTNNSCHTSSTRIFLEDLNLPSGSIRMCVLHLPGNCYTANTGQLRGTTRMTIDSLECKDIKVVPINSVIWDQLGETEKISYMEEQIRMRVTDFDSLSQLRNA